MPSEDELVPVECDGNVCSHGRRVNPKRATRLHANFGRLKHVRRAKFVLQCGHRGRLKGQFTESLGDTRFLVTTESEADTSRTRGAMSTYL